MELGPDLRDRLLATTLYEWLLLLNIEHSLKKHLHYFSSNNIIIINQLKIYQEITPVGDR